MKRITRKFLQFVILNLCKQFCDSNINNKSKRRKASAISNSKKFVYTVDRTFFAFNAILKKFKEKLRLLRRSQLNCLHSSVDKLFWIKWWDNFEDYDVFFNCFALLQIVCKLLAKLFLNGFVRAAVCSYNSTYFCFSFKLNFTLHFLDEKDSWCYLTHLISYILLYL